MGIATFGSYFLMNMFMPKAVATILAILVAVPVYGVSLIKLGALSRDEVVALPKGATLYRVFVKLHLMKDLAEILRKNKVSKMKIDKIKYRGEVINALIYIAKLKNEEPKMLLDRTIVALLKELGINLIKGE